MDWAAARLAYEGAIKEVDGISDPYAKEVTVDCQHNIDYIRAMEGPSDAMNIIQFKFPQRH